MPAFLVPLYEHNDCHAPAGSSAGGQFCSDPDAFVPIPRPDKEAHEYRGEHGAAERGSGAPLHDLTGGGTTYPDDVYGPEAVRYYGTSEPTDTQTYAIIQRFRGRPKAMVTIYRAVPLDVAGEIAHLEKRQRAILRRGSDDPKEFDRNYKELEALRRKPPSRPIVIHPGDWVTINRRYAKDHGEGTLQGRYRILSKSVRAGDLFTSGDSWHEWGWDPEEA
jgi:hypothetical protein